jgi:D-beta-D-heptose 7-phosphate kinase/D-beta-D-heptose 1-phosphate adenosyltransferase
MVDFSNVTVLCVGDVILDRYIQGAIDRISPEAPVPVLRMTGDREVIGGAGNVANNIATLGGKAILVALVAADHSGEAVRKIIGGLPGVTERFVSTKHRPTLTKTRFMAGRQQVMRADQEIILPVQPDEEEGLMSAIGANLGSVQAVLLSDYGKAVLSRKLLDFTISQARVRAIPVFVDPKTDDFSRYLGATCITPNLKELGLASRMPVADEDMVVVAAQRVMADARAEAILVTRSELGMMLVEANGAVQSIPTKAREVFDVSGAGDTVIATLSLSVASGLTLSEGMRLANAAAGVVVSKLGTATVDIEELSQELEEQELVSESDLRVLISHARIATLVTAWKRRGLKVGFTNGCFDILHPGHVALLRAARSECDRLVVALNSDRSISRLKGPSRPINTLADRAQVIGSLRYVDCVVQFNDDTPSDLIARLMPDVLIKGGDYSVDTVVGADIVQAAGGRVVIASLVEGLSTTNVIRRLDQAGAKSFPTAQ